MKIKTHLFFVLILFAFSANGQVADTVKQSEVVNRTFGLLAGVSIGKNTFAELGFSKSSFTVEGHHPFSSVYFASVELKPVDKFMIGPKIGGWIAGGCSGIAIGANMIYYTDFDDGSLVFRPEIGIGLDIFKIVYGYNAILSQFKLEGINRNLASIVFCFRLKKLKDKTRSN